MKQLKIGNRAIINEGPYSGNIGIVLGYASEYVVQLLLDQTVNINTDDGVETTKRLDVEEDLLSSFGEVKDWEVFKVKKEDVPPTKDRSQIVTLHDAFRNEHQNKKPDYSGVEKERYSKGLCPHCGEEGKFSHCQPVCSKHGPY